MINSFLLIGQSNMAGRGIVTEVAPIINENVVSFKSGQWVTAAEPLHNDKPELAGIGPGVSFADYLQKKYDKTIGLIPCAFGGTAIMEWQKEGSLYTNAVEQTREAILTSKLKGILWHQGESDTHTLSDAQLYKGRFETFIADLLNDIGNLNIPIIIGQLGEFLKDNTTHQNFDIVNKSLLEITSTKASYGFVTTEGLKHRGDLLHFDSVSQRALGIRYAKSYDECSMRLGISLE